MKINTTNRFRDNLPRHRWCYVALRTKKTCTRFLGQLSATLGINRKYLIKPTLGKLATDYAAPPLVTPLEVLCHDIALYTNPFVFWSPRSAARV